MQTSFRIALRHSTFNDLYVFDAVWNSLGEYYRIYIVRRPNCPYPAGDGGGHILGRNLVCVARGCEPRTKERTKAIAMRWLHGFSTYCRTGSFPNGAATVNVNENSPRGSATSSERSSERSGPA